MCTAGRGVHQPTGCRVLIVSQLHTSLASLVQRGSATCVCKCSMGATLMEHHWHLTATTATLFVFTQSPPGLARTASSQSGAQPLTTTQSPPGPLQPPGSHSEAQPGYKRRNSNSRQSLCGATQSDVCKAPRVAQCGGKHLPTTANIFPYLQ